MKTNKIKLQGSDGAYNIYLNGQLKFLNIAATHCKNNDETAYRFAKFIVQELSKSEKTGFIDETPRGKLEQLAKQKADFA